MRWWSLVLFLLLVPLSSVEATPALEACQVLVLHDDDRLRETRFDGPVCIYAGSRVTVAGNVFLRGVCVFHQGKLAFLANRVHIHPNLPLWSIFVSLTGELRVEDNHFFYDPSLSAVCEVPNV